MRIWSSLVVPALVLVGAAPAVQASNGLPVQLVSSVGQMVNANVVPAIAVEIEMGPEATWSSTGTELKLMAPIVRVQSNTNYAFQETSSATGVHVSVTCMSAGTMCPNTASSTTAGAREYAPQLSQIIDFHRGGNTADWRVQIVHTFTPAGV